MPGSPVSRPALRATRIVKKSRRGTRKSIRTKGPGLSRPRPGVKRPGASIGKSRRRGSLKQVTRTRKRRTNNYRISNKNPMGSPW